MTSDHTMYLDKSPIYFSNPRSEIGPLLPGRVDKVLEVGCGSGATMKWLRTQRDVRRAVGIELFPEAATQAASTFDDVLSGNIETMRLPEEKFDLIIALDVLEHLIDPWTAIRRLHSILTPAGALLVSLPNIGHYSISMPLLYRGQWNYKDDGLLDRTHLRFFTTKSGIELLTSSNLVVDQVEYVLRGPKFWSPTSRWYGLKLLQLLAPGHLFVWQTLIRLINP